jgi:hypothetical protein
MQTIMKLINIGILLSLFSCGQSSNDTVHDTTSSSKKTRGTAINSTNTKFDYIIFGRYCGECGGECATMYKLDIVNNQLLADHTDSYWDYKLGTPMKFETHIDIENKMLIAKQILDSIPQSILTMSKPAERFGCPDCTDGCGIFLETRSDTTIKKFYIDYQTGQLTGDIKPYAERLKKIIDKL